MSQERVSSLEKEIREKAIGPPYDGEYDVGSTHAYQDAADMVHERDEQLRTLVNEIEAYGGRETIPIAAHIRAILEGKVE